MFLNYTAHCTYLYDSDFGSAHYSDSSSSTEDKVSFLLFLFSSLAAVSN
jgi:hypothetical protein